MHNKGGGGDPSKLEKSKQQKEREKDVDGEKTDWSDLLWYPEDFCVNYLQLYKHQHDKMQTYQKQIFQKLVM